MKSYAIVLSLISATLFAWVLGSEADEIALRDVLVFGIALAGILATQSLLLYLLDRRLLPARHKELMLGIIAAVFLAANAYFLAFYTLEQPTLTRASYAAVVGVIFFVLMRIERARPVLALFAGVMLAMSLFQYGYTRATFAAVDFTDETASLPIKSKRNVYIIGMESLQSPTAYRENYDVEEAPHVRLLRELGFRVLQRAYSAERSTLRSYSHIFEFNREFKGTDLGARGVFSNDNSTFRSFRDSNYDIQFLYKSNYFPVAPELVDYLFPPPSFDACDELGSAYFYGLCNKKIVRVINEYVIGSPKIGWKAQIPLLQERTDAIVGTSQPWFTWTHIKFPFHTHGYMQHPDPEYAAKFKREVHDALPVIADNIRKTAGYIVDKDPNAVVIVLGDHGTHLFRGEEDKVRKLVYSGEPLWPLHSILEDQHGVNLAVYPADFCTNRISELFSTRGLMKNVIACLNGDDSPSGSEKERAHTIRFLGELKDVRELRPQVLAEPRKNAH